MEKFNYYIPTRIIFGAGALKKLAKQALPGKKALIVTTNGRSVIKYGYLDQLAGQLKEAGIESLVYPKILPNPTKESVMEGARLCRENGVDFVIGLGGGSAIDAAKAIAVMATNPGDYWDYMASGSGKKMQVQHAPLPVVAITTTAGTGTEADPWMVVTKTETNEKTGFGFDQTFPVLAVVDPELMRTVPPFLTACQGFDALFHSMEGYLNKYHNVMSDLYAFKAVALIGESLSTAVTDGNNLEARGNVALANTLSGMVESTSGCISEHSLAHALAAYHPNLEHGAALITVSVPYYTFLAESGACNARMIQLAKALGEEDASCAMDLVTALLKLQKACGVDNIQLREYGVEADAISKYADNARETMGGLFAGDPAEIGREAVIGILQKAVR
ncbi:MAG: iron-containing alcohol dehydrogenase [Christensenella sp.]|nr:iron-containing alcohol dehydrogenase [Christensenella sp.]